MRSKSALPVVRIGQPKEPFADLYHLVHMLSWPILFLLFLLVFVSLNVGFALLIGLGGDCITGADPNSFSDRFFFSVQSLTTIGYGVMSPKTTYANILVTSEAFVGIFSTALMTGILFAKFSLPKTRVLFTHNALFCKRDGLDSLIFRLANGRGNGIASVEFEVTLIIDDVTSEGESTRRLLPIPLVVQRTPLLMISFTAVHVVNDTSPLCGLSLDELSEKHAVLVVTVRGTDDIIGQAVHAQHFYRAGDFRKGKGFADVLQVENLANDFQYIMDYTKFHQIVKAD